MSLTRRRFILTSLFLAAGCRTLEETGREDKKALLVSPYDLRLDDLFLMDFLLQQRGFQTNILSGDQCSEPSIFGKLEEIAKFSQPGSKTLFYYGGHYPVEVSEPGGSFLTYEGVKVSGQGDAERLSPEELFVNLGNVRGKKAAVIDACHSGIYSDYAAKNELLENYVVIAACPLGTETPFGNVFISGRYTGALTYGIYMTLSNSGGVNLSTAEINCGTDEYRRMSQEQLKSIIKSGDFPISFEMQREFDTDFWI